MIQYRRFSNHNTKPAYLALALLLGLLLTLSWSSPLYAKTAYFSMSQPDISQYPTVRASFSAIQANGQYFEDMQPSDFLIYENQKQIPPSKIGIECEEQVPAEILLVLDNSTSMGEIIEGKQKWQWVKESVLNFIDEVTMPAGSSIGIIIFNSDPKLICDFTDDKEKLLASLDGLTYVQAPTDFNNCFLDKQAGVAKLLEERPYDHKRIAIMLSDGNHTVERGAFKYEEIKEQLNINNISCYTITYLEPKVSSDLMTIANGTGGDSEHVTSPNQLDDIYSMISNALFQKPLCFLIWESSLSCDPVESFRDLEASFKTVGGSIIKYQYVAPEWSIFTIETDQEIYNFGNPAIDVPDTMDIVLSPSLDVTISDFLIIPSDYFKIVDFGNKTDTKPYSEIKIKAGETRTLKVEFTQKVKQSPRFAVLFLEASPCPLEIPLLAGNEQIVITNPVEGNIYSACEKIDIQWTGIPETQKIELLYSTNYGHNWNTITNNAKGGSFTWTPPYKNANYQIKGLVQYTKEYKWLINSGGAANETVNTIAAQDNELFFSVCGTYDADTEIEGKDAQNRGGSDWFVARYDGEGGNRWVQTGSGTYDENAAACVIDPTGNTYVTGRAYDGMKIGQYTAALIKPGYEYTYLAKFSPYGELLGIVYIEPTDASMTFKSWGTALRFDFDGVNEPRITIRGKYTGQYTNGTLGAYLTDVKYPTNYTAEYSTNLVLKRIIGAYEAPNTGFASKSVTFPSNTIYTTNNFSDSHSVGGFTVNSNGGRDYWVSKQAIATQNEDISDKFSVIIPQVEATYNVFIKDSLQVFATDSTYIFCDSIYIGQEETISLNKILTNNTALPVTITSYNLTLEDGSYGEAVECFSLAPDIIDQAIGTGDSANIDIIFHPTMEYDCIAYLELVPDCGASITLRLVGHGLCKAEPVAELDCGSTLIGQSDTLIFTETFYNPMTMPITIKPIINSDSEHKNQWKEFELISPASGTELTVSPFETINFQIAFTPITAGERECFIDYNAPYSCVVPHTIIKGYGLNGKLYINNLDWGRERTNTSFAAQNIVINNVGNTTKTIDKIEFADNAMKAIFVFDENIAMGDIPGNDSITIPVNFTPVEIKAYSANVTFYSTDGDTLITVLRGDTYLPEMTYTTECADDINVGQKGEAYIEITNPSSSSDLTIESITIDNTDEFAWQTGTYTDLTVENGNPVRLFLDYTPTQTGSHATNLIINADNYDGTYTSEWKETTVPLSCDALELKPQIPAPQTCLLCDDLTYFISVENTSNATTAYCYLQNATITGEGNQYFTIEGNELEVQGRQTEQITVLFNSDTEGTYDVTISIPTSASEPITANISATVSAMTPSCPLKEITLLPGKEQRLFFDMDIPTTTKGTVEELNILVKQDNYGLIFDWDTFKSQDENMVWETPEIIDDGVINIKGTGSLTLPYKASLFSMNYRTMLAPELTTQISYDINYECTTKSFDVHLLKAEDMCVSENRRVVIGKEALVSAPIPNPVENSFNLDFTISFDETPVTIDIYNTLGQKVGSLLNQQMQSGTYDMTFSTDTIESGAYILRFHAGYYIQDIQLLIVK